MLKVTPVLVRGFRMIRSLATAAALFAVALTAFADKPVSAPLSGQKLPAVSLTNTDGKPVPLADVRGKVATVLVFVSFECPVSTYYLSGLNDLAKKHEAAGVKVVAIVPADEQPAAISKHAVEFKLGVPVYLDTKKDVAAAVGATITPEAVVIDAAGKV